MKKSIYLSPMEYELMMIFWNLDRSLTVSEILENRKEGTWAKNSVHPMLKNLLEKGFLEVSGTQKVSKVNSRLYKAKISMAEYISNQVAEVYKNKRGKFNIACFMSGLLGGDRASDEKIIAELENWIKDQNDILTNEKK